MSIGMTKADGVTVLTLTSDPQSVWPPLCQILKTLCYNPVCCRVSQRLRKGQRTSQSVLGTLQIMVGLLNIGLGTVVLCSLVNTYPVNYTLFPVWLGILFILFGTSCILSEKYPSPCLVIVNVILNLAGVAFAITGIVLYSISIGNIYVWWGCENNDYWYRPTASPSPQDLRIQEACSEGEMLLLMLLRSIEAVLIVLSVLELCVTISSLVLGIKALKKTEKGDVKSTADPEYYKPLLEEATTDPVV